MTARTTGRAARVRQAEAPPGSPGWPLAALVGPVAAGWVFGAGALCFEFAVPVWLVAMAGTEIAIAVALGTLLLTRSAAITAWWAGAAGWSAGWATYVTAAGPWTWAGELTLVLPAAVFILLWPVAHADAS
jgi:hypothetical protein